MAYRYSVQLTDVSMGDLKRKVLAFEVLFDCDATVKVRGIFYEESEKQMIFDDYQRVEHIGKDFLLIKDQAGEVRWCAPSGYDREILNVLIEGE